MNYIYNQEDVNRVIEKNNIVDVVREYQDLTKGEKSYIGKCDFDKDGLKSLFVNQKHQVFHCVCCGANGNVINYVMKKDNISFDDALSKLATRVKLPMPNKEVASQKERLYACNKEAAKFYAKCLFEKRGQRALSYFKDTRLLRDETIKVFLLGYAPKGNLLKTHLQSKGFTEDEMINAGLVRKDEKYGLQDVFYNRAMFPILDVNKNILGFGGRALEESKSKYINTKETDIFHKKENLYGLNRAKNEDLIIFCEGYVDVIAMQQIGYRGAIASLGTALTDEQIDLIASKNIYLAYDSDAAGQKATIRALSMISAHGKTGKLISLEPYKDPDEFIKNEGRTAFMQRIENAKDGIVFRKEYIEQKYANAENRQGEDFIKDVVSLINDINIPEERNKIIRELTNHCSREVKQSISARVHGFNIIISSDTEER